MQKKILFLSFLFPSYSYAEDLNILQCEYDDLYKTGCSVQNITISENDPFEMDYSVRYKYDCSGHDFSVGIQTEVGFYPFIRKIGEQNVIATGQSRVYLKAQDPGALYYKILQKNCSVEFVGITKRPSVQTLIQWNQNSKSEITLLYAMLDNYQLAKNLDDIDSWNIEKLILLKNNLEKLVNVYPTNLSFKVILHTVALSISNKPPKITIPGDAKIELFTYYKNNLEYEIQNAENMIAKYNLWKIQLDTDLQKEINNIKTMFS
jgi:hypothetical protein